MPSAYKNNSNKELRNNTTAIRPIEGAIVGRLEIACFSVTIYALYDILHSVKIAIIIILAVSVAIVSFFFGWVELALPAGTHGIAFTKSGGWDKSPVVPGGVTWRWERLIPTNMTLYKFDLTPRVVEGSISGALPSADRYAAEIDIDPSHFNYDLRLICQLRLRAEYLPQLVAESDLRPDKLSALYQQTASAAAAAAVTELLSEEMPTPSVSIEMLGDQVRQWITFNHPEIDVVKIDLIPHSLPDPDLYLQAKAAFASRIDSQQHARLAVLDEMAQAREQAIQRLDLLQMFGVVLDDFPHLVELLSSDPHLLSQVLQQVMGVAENPSN